MNSSIGVKKILIFSSSFFASAHSINDQNSEILKSKSLLIPQATHARGNWKGRRYTLKFGVKNSARLVLILALGDEDCDHYTKVKNLTTFLDKERFCTIVGIRIKVSLDVIVEWRFVLQEFRWAFQQRLRLPFNETIEKAHAKCSSRNKPKCENK